MRIASIKREDFTVDGVLNEKAFKQARIDIGEECCECGSYIVFPVGYKSACSECRDLLKDEELMHSSRIRCPKCRRSWIPAEAEQYKVYEDGEHEVSCDCGYNFTVSTYIEYTFTSPEIIKEDGAEYDE